jgi:hypothetical protein
MVMGEKPNTELADDSPLLVEEEEKRRRKKKKKKVHMQNLLPIICY